MARPRVKKRKPAWAQDPTQDPLYPFPKSEVPAVTDTIPPPKKKPSLGSIKARYRREPEY